MLCAALLLSAPAQAQPADAQPANPPAAEAAGPDQQPAADNVQSPLPRIETMEVPSMASLLKDPPVDWVVLENQLVVICQPVYPRPDTLAKIQQQIDELERRRRTTPPDEFRTERSKLQKLVLLLPDDDETVYEVDREKVDRILHHEDLILMRVDALIAESKFRDAFEMLFLLKRRQPDWPGVENRQNDLLFAEAGIKITAGEFEPALVLLEELGERNKTYPGLTERMGAAVDGLVAAAVGDED
ncbi:MAG TPA: hypothetical protein VML55_12910, partial [Planctomycetaceae bacterium]|nr:hypothetical protein [Planctomycetaceae bacterium]